MNLIIYVLDALRADHLSCYGYTRETSPSIDAIADEGLVYENCFTVSTWTKPVGASILTGVYPPTHGVRTREDVFNTDIARLPEELSSDGFTTAGFSTMGNVSKSIGYGKGFDEYFDLYKDPEIIQKRQTTDSSSEELELEEENKIALPRAEDLTDRLIEWTEDLNDDDEDFFAFCWSIEPHIPYDPPEGYRDFTDPSYTGPIDGSRECLPEVKSEEDLEQLKSLYDGEIRYNDAQIGRMVDWLKENGMYNETLLVLLSDHGDAFKDHGRLTHGHLPYDELIRVPLIVKPPESLGIEPDRIKETVSVIDIFPTVLEMLGIEKTEASHVQGQAIVGGSPRPDSAPVFSETRSRDIYPAFYSVRTEKRKYMEVHPPKKNLGTIFKLARQLIDRGLIWDIIRDPRYFLERYRHEDKRFLFDLESDPEEQHNLVKKQPREAEALEEALNEGLTFCGKVFEEREKGEGKDIDESVNKQLRELGYID